MDWNDLLIEILNMTPEQRKKPVRYSSLSGWCASDVGVTCERLYTDQDGDIYLVQD
jgi:hypothetical protein